MRWSTAPPTEVGGMVSESQRARLLVAWVAIALAVALAIALPRPAVGQEALSFTVTLEPGRATVGDHLTLTIVARHPPGTELEAPDEPADFAPLELVEVRLPETRPLADGLQETRFAYVLAAFQTGEVRPPPLRIAALGAEPALVTLEPPAVVIESVLPDEGPAPLRDLRAPIQASTGTPTWVWAALLSAGFVGLSVLTMALVRYPVRRPPPPLAVVAEAPDEAARRELDAIARAGLLDRGERKDYYRRIAACLREYLSRRFGVPAVALTAQELEARLEAVAVDRWPARLAVNLLEQCQAVQFAQYEPARERAEADLASAYEVVALTAPSPEAPRPDEPAARRP